jgi:hypothetical protein
MRTGASFFGCKADYTPPTSVVLRTREALSPVRHTSSWRSVYISTGFAFMEWYLLNSRDSFTFTLHIEGTPWSRVLLKKLLSQTNSSHVLPLVTEQVKVLFCLF